ncbi:MAG: metal-sensing transcriptional repressor [Oscillospiraceae bacterium]|nr:metal-sensing transcriptional repressor [Oscillospiraceae bacterium]
MGEQDAARRGEHGHGHTQTQAVLNRLSRAIGHLESIRKMVEDGRDCSEVLIQLAAVQSALSGAGRVILKDHIAHCIVDAVETGDRAAIDDLNRAIDRLWK